MKYDSKAEARSVARDMTLEYLRSNQIVLPTTGSPEELGKHAAKLIGALFGELSDQLSKSE